MRIVIDLQGAQSTGSRNRGIGRYSLALADAIARLRGEHEVWLVLNGLFADTVEGIRAHFAGLIPSEHIRVWSGTPNVSELGPEGSAWRRQACELLLETCISNLRPDVVLMTSVFEGLVDDAVTSIGRVSRSIPTAMVLYDLIPLMNRKLYLENPAIEAWYERKLTHARRASLLLAISESSRQEAIHYLAVPANTCVAISTAADPLFGPVQYTASECTSLRERHGLQRPYVMYTGGIDHRKNIEGLIRAFAGLPSPIRLAHQLAIVCSIHATDRDRLTKLVDDAGLEQHDVVFTGFVSEADLLALYNLCTLFVFPSWHEGFGLPALEAMACGRAVISANTSSLPEVLGRSDAMFDPFDDDAITAKMAEVLSDPQRLQELELHGLRQSKLFSWDITGAKALRALEQLHATALAARPVQAASPTCGPRRLRLAMVTPLEPTRTGIASYVSELLPELARHYEVDLISTQPEVTDLWARANGRVRTPDWLIEHADRFDRVLYQMGNSEFHRHMFALLEQVPGVVVLHDFFLGHLVEHMHGTGLRAGDRTSTLYRNHGYGAVHADLIASDSQDVTWDYPCNLEVIQQARGILVHSQDMCQQACDWYGERAADGWAVIPHLRKSLPTIAKAAARKLLGLPEQDFVVCSFGMVGPTKLSRILLTAWLESALSRDGGCHLVFVGANEPGAYGAALTRDIGHANLRDRLLVTGWVSTERYRLYLAAADVAVQLRERSRGETSGAVLDCLNVGLATIVNRHGSLGELANGTVWSLPARVDNVQLVEALEMLWRDGEIRARLGQRGRHEIELRHSPRHCAALYAIEIERIYASPAADGGELTSAVAGLEQPSPRLWDWHTFARAAATSLPSRPASRQLLVDVSVIAQTDARTGIQRVVRSVLHHWLTKGAGTFRVEPIYAADDGGYRYAHRYTVQFLGGAPEGRGDAPLDVRPGDLFVALDLNPNMTPAHLAYQQQLRQLGVTVAYVVYDLLPVLLPHRFWDEATRQHHRWLNAVAASDRAVCISRSVADELFEWLDNFGNPRPRPLAIDWFHLGADVETSRPSEGLPVRADATLKNIADATAVLMVSTLEPRKRHDQVLDAMEQLWNHGDATSLVMVGKVGWNVEQLTRRLRTHSELNRRLFWFESASDEWLRRLYAVCDGVIVASEGEGFGLTIVEAARHELPLLLRDIPVFREVASGFATFFTASSGEELAAAMSVWTAQLRSRMATKPNGLPFLTWEQSSTALIKGLLSEPPYRLWRHSGVYRFQGGDIRLSTDVGVRRNDSMLTTGRAGFLTWGPAIELAPGSYDVEISGELARHGRDGSFFEITVDGGTKILAKSVFGSNSPETGTLMRLTFDSNQRCSALEFRLWVTETAVARIDGFCLTQSAIAGRITQPEMLD